jgi:two-component system sensor histidine kinase/response regulator
MQRKKRIVVADDEPYIASLLADFLEGEGYRVRVAYDGEQALAAALEERPDLLVSDVMMPRRSGLQLVQAVRAEPHLREVPIVLTSAGRVPDICWPGVEFIPKPFQLEDILEVTAQRTGNKARGRPSSAA